MNRVVLATILLVFGADGARAEPQVTQCSSFYISEINLVSTTDGEAGHVQTFVGFGPSKEEAEKSALGWCSHIRFDLETCLNSDRLTARNYRSDGGDAALDLKYMKAVARITGYS